jgi:DNA-directed RNA polymerase II subunit RPB4
VKQVRYVLSRNGLGEFELCVIGNICPETVEEVKAMVPFLKTKGRACDDERIEKMLNDLAIIKKLE